MILIIVSVLALVAGILILTYGRYRYEGFGVLLTVIGGATTLLIAVLLPVHRYSYWSDKAKLEAFKETLNYSRENNPTDLERVSMLKDIAEWNEIIASCKFDNAHGWDLWVPDDVEKLELIK